jgi:hypothetical protein
MAGAFFANPIPAAETRFYFMKNKIKSSNNFSIRASEVVSFKEFLFAFSLVP